MAKASVPPQASPPYLPLTSYPPRKSSAPLRLKESLAQALASRSGGAIPEFDTDTPAERTLRVLDQLMHGEQV